MSAKPQVHKHSHAGNTVFPKDRVGYRLWVKDVAACLRDETRGTPLEDRVWKRATALELCVTGLKIEVCAACGDPRPASGLMTSESHPCNSRVCPHCARRRSTSEAEWARKIVGQVERDRSRDYRFRHIVLTARYDKTNPEHLTVEALRERFLGLSRAWAFVWRKYLKRDGAGAWKSAECSGTGNVHIHVLYWGPFVNKAHLEQLAREGWPAAGHTWVSEVDGLETVPEVVKYTLKSPGGRAEHWFGGHSRWVVNPRLAARWELAILGSRVAERYGCFRKIPRPEDEEYEEIELLDVCPCGCSEWVVEYFGLAHGIRFCHQKHAIAFRANRIRKRESRAGPGDHHEEEREGQADSADRSEGTGRAEAHDRSGSGGSGRAKGEGKAWTQTGF